MKKKLLTHKKKEKLIQLNFTDNDMGRPRGRFRVPTDIQQ